MTESPKFNERARRLRDLVEPLAAGIYFAPEAHRAYAGLGFGPSPVTVGGVEMPDGAAYFTSRGACMGRVPGEVVASAFGVFNPSAVVPAVTHGWSLTDPEAILSARLEGARGSLARMIGPDPDGVARATGILRRAAEAADVGGHALYAGLLSLGWPGDPVGDLWRAADLVREHRGDSHIAAWLAAGLDGVEIGLVTELWWGLPPRSYIRTRAWSDDQMDAALERLRSIGWVDASGGLSATGRAGREEIESATDAAERKILEAIGDDLAELDGVLGPWGKAIVTAGGYPAGAGALMGRSG